MVDTTRRVTLKYSRVGDSFEVDVVQNSALLKSGDWINHDYRRALVKSGVWEVTTVSLDFHLPNLPIPIPGVPVLGRMGAAAPTILSPPENVDE